MDGIWGKVGSLLSVGLFLLVGCRTMPPKVKPPEGPEVLNPPPMEARYNAPNLPKQAFNRDDPSKRYREMDQNQVMPARGSFGGPSRSGF